MELTYQLNVNKIFIILNGYICACESFRLKLMLSLDFHTLIIKHLMDPSQPPPFSMPSKVLILHGQAKSYSFTVSCVSESMFKTESDRKSSNFRF